MQLPDGNISSTHLSVLYSQLIRQHDALLSWRLEITVRCPYYGNAGFSGKASQPCAAWTDIQRPISPPTAPFRTKLVRRTGYDPVVDAVPTYQLSLLAPPMRFRDPQGSSQMFHTQAAANSTRSHRRIIPYFSVCCYIGLGSRLTLSTLSLYC